MDKETIDEVQGLLVHALIDFKYGNPNEGVRRIEDILDTHLKVKTHSLSLEDAVESVYNLAIANVNNNLEREAVHVVHDHFVNTVWSDEDEPTSDDPDDTSLWLVSGRVSGDDDDTIICIEVGIDDDPAAMFINYMLRNTIIDNYAGEPEVFIIICQPLSDFTDDPVRKEDCQPLD